LNWQWRPEEFLEENTPLVFPAALPYNQPMLNADRLNEIHRLYHGEHWSMRKIARHLHLARKTLRKYLHSPVQASARRPRTRKIDPFKSTVAGLLEQDPSASAVVILQRLRPLGYEGGITLLRAYVSQLRSPRHPPRAFVRMEPSPGERCEIDWGHFGTLDYAGDKRKLYAFCLVEGHSRMLYVEFTHSQSFETFVRCHLHAFQALGGVARECWYDNLLTVVAEHVGTLVRFNPRFLAFARECDFYPRACNPAAGWEKGKVERGGVGYVRQNFWPLRQFTDLADVNRQAREWLQEVANQRLHRETRQRPGDRFRPDCLRPLPALTPDYRDTTEALVQKDLRLQFDGNRYCAPPHLVGQRLIVKADASSVALYHRHQEIVRYPRCWRRGQTLGAERFEKELLAHRAAAQRSEAQRRLIALLVGDCTQETVEAYLRGLADSNRALSRQITELLHLIRQYGPEAVAGALQKALTAGAFGADDVANLLRQQLAPRNPQPPLQLRDPELNRLVTDPLSLLDYDAFILDARKEPYDATRTEARTTEALDHEPEPRTDAEGGGDEEP
jgi:transposase